MLAQTTLCTLNEHCITLLSADDKEIAQVTEVVLTAVVLTQLPQFDVMLYWNVEQLEFTDVQLNTSCS